MSWTGKQGSGRASRTKAPSLGILCTGLQPRAEPLFWVSWNRQTSSLSGVVPDGRSSIRIFDALGNCVYRNANLVQGANEVRPGLKAGFYAVRVQTGARQTSLNITVKE